MVNKFYNAQHHFILGCKCDLVRLHALLHTTSGRHLRLAGHMWHSNFSKCSVQPVLPGDSNVHCPYRETSWNKHKWIIITSLKSYRVHCNLIRYVSIYWYSVACTPTYIYQVNVEAYYFIPCILQHFSVLTKPSSG